MNLCAARNDMEGRESGQYGDAVVVRDRYRTACHDSVIGQANVINRICIYLDLPEVMPGIDQMSRRDIAMPAFDILADMTMELY